MRDGLERSNEWRREGAADGAGREPGAPHARGQSAESGSTRERQRAAEPGSAARGRGLTDREQDERWPIG